MEAIVGEEIRIRDCTESAFRYFMEQLTVDNPEYQKRISQGRWAGNVPRKLSLWQRDGGDIIVPFGMLPEIFKRRKAFDGTYGTFRDVSTHNYGSTISTYPYQEEAVKNALKARQGVIVAPCGSGKTMIGLEIAARIGGRTLWLTHTTDLLNQSMSRAKVYMSGLADADYGTITGGKVDIGNVITFATVQTMSRLDLSKFYDTWDCVVVDEAHHVVGTPTQLMMFYRVISSLHARYKYGLTATPKRSDGLQCCMFSLIGPKICEIAREALMETTCPVRVIVRKTNYAPDVDWILTPDGTISYPRFLSDIVANEARNNLIVEDVKNSSGSCLVLTDRVQHVEELKKKLVAAGVSCCSLSASAKKEERAEILRKLKDGEVRVLVATYALAKEGLDVPNLNNLFFATPQKNETTVVQACGRVARRSSGKEFGTLYDYEDSFSMLSTWQRKRNSIYKRLGYFL